MELAFRLLANILTLAAYERARRALRGECEPTALAPKVRRLIRVYELRPQSKHPPRMRVILNGEHAKTKFAPRASEVYFVSEVILRIVKFCLRQSGQT